MFRASGTAVASATGTTVGLDLATATRPAPARDDAIDVLRGWAIVLMILSHTGAATRLATLAHLPVWLSAADSFLLISGVVLGWRASERMKSAEPALVYRGVWRRAGQLWLVHCALMLAVVAIHESTGRLNVAPVAELGGWLSALALIVVLRFQSVDYMNILPLFIVCFLLAPVGLELMRRGLTLVWIGASAALFAYAQRDPAVLPLVDPIAGPLVFSIGAWQFVFALGVAIGFHRARLAALWRAQRAFILPASLGIAAALFIAAQLQRSGLSQLGLVLPERLEWLFSKQTWGPGRALYTLVLLGLAYAALRQWERRAPHARSVVGRALQGCVHEPLRFMGRHSLYCFVMHLPFALLASAAGVEGWPTLFQEAFTAGSVGAVFMLARWQVLAQLLPR